MSEFLITTFICLIPALVVAVCACVEELNKIRKAN